MKSFLAGYDLSGKYIARSACMAVAARLKRQRHPFGMPNSTILGSLAVYGKPGGKIHAAMWRRNGSNKWSILKNN